MKTDPNTLMPKWLTTTLLIGLATILVVMPFHAFISTWGGTVIGPLWLWKAWKEILLAALLVPTLGWIVASPPVAKQLFKDRLILAVTAYVLLTVIASLLTYDQVGAEAAAAAIGMNLRYFAVAALAFILIKFSDLAWRQWRRRIIIYLVGIASVLAVIGIAQVSLLPTNFLERFGYDKDTTIAPYTLIDENPDAKRAFATLRGPNDFGAFLILPLLISLFIGIRHKRVWTLSFIILLALFESSSRSAWLGAMISLASFGWLVYGGKALVSKKVVWGMVGGLAVATTIFMAAISIPSVRLEVFHSSPGDSSLTEGSTDAHWRSTASGIQRVIGQPLGCGPGCAGPASYYSDKAFISENYYVQLAEEVGLIGLGIWLYIAGLVAARLYQLRRDWFVSALLASFVGISAIGFWLHVWADDPLSLTWWLIAGAILGAASRKDQKQLS